MNSLPAYLANRKRQDIGTAVASGIRAGMPAHISLYANRFTLVDGAGNQRPVPTLHLDLAVHLHHLVYYTTGLKPLEATSMQDRFGCFEAVADNVIALARYTEGAAAQFWFSKSALGHRNGLRLRIYGERAAAEWVQGEPETITGKVIFTVGR